MSESICWNCRHPIQPGRDVRCPYCRAQLPRFYTVVFARREADPQAVPRPHPDPLKRREAAYAVHFRVWLGHEFPVPPDTYWGTHPPSSAPVPPQPVAPPSPATLPALDVPMIHNVLLITRDGRRVFHRQYWSVEITTDILQEFTTTLNQLQHEIGPTVDIPIHVKGMKFLYVDAGPHLLLVFGADASDDDKPVRERLTKARTLLLKNYGHEIDAYIAKPDPTYKGFEKFRADLDTIVVTRLRLCILGFSDTNGTEIVRLLSGGVPPDLYGPTVAVDVGGDRSPQLRIGSLEMVVWDFSGVDKKFRSLWRYYLRNADAVLLITDSTLKNVLETRGILEIVRKESPWAGVLAIAANQDLPGALSPALVQRILRIQAVGLATNELKTPNPALAVRILSEVFRSWQT